jgi:hypothetical protein
VLVILTIFREIVWPLALDVAGNETSALLESGDVARERAERRHHEQLVSQALAEISRQLNSLPVALEPHAATVVRTRAIVRESPHLNARKLDHLVQGVSVRFWSGKGSGSRLSTLQRMSRAWDGRIATISLCQRRNLTK